VLIETNSYELWPADTMAMPCGRSPSRETGGTELKGPDPGLGASEYEPGGVGPVLGYDGEACPLRLYDEYEGLGLALVEGAWEWEASAPPVGSTLTLLRRRVAD